MIKKYEILIVMLSLVGALGIYWMGYHEAKDDLSWPFKQENEEALNNETFELVNPVKKKIIEEGIIANTEFSGANQLQRTILNMLKTDESLINALKYNSQSIQALKEHDDLLADKIKELFYVTDVITEEIKTIKRP